MAIKDLCCDCTPGPDVLIGPGRDSYCSAHFHVRDKPVVVQLYPGSDQDCVELYHQKEVCGDLFCRPVTESCCQTRLHEKNTCVVLYKPGTYSAKVVGGVPEDMLVCQNEAEFDVVVNVEGDKGVSNCIRFVELPDGSVGLYVDGRVEALGGGGTADTNTTYTVGTNAAGQPALIGSDGSVSPFNLPAGTVDTNTTYAPGVDASGNPTLVGSDGTVAPIAVPASGGTGIDTNTTYSVGVDDDGNPALVGSDGTADPFNFPTGGGTVDVNDVVTAIIASPSAIEAMAGPLANAMAANPIAMQALAAAILSAGTNTGGSAYPNQIWVSPADNLLTLNTADPASP